MIGERLMTNDNLHQILRS